MYQHVFKKNNLFLIYSEKTPLENSAFLYSGKNVTPVRWVYFLCKLVN